MSNYCLPGKPTGARRARIKLEGSSVPLIPMGSSPSQRPGTWRRWVTHVPTGTEEAQKCMEWQSNSYTLNRAFPRFFPEHSSSLCPVITPPVSFLPAVAGFFSSSVFVLSLQILPPLHLLSCLAQPCPA